MNWQQNVNDDTPGHQTHLIVGQEASRPGEWPGCSSRACRGIEAVDERIIEGEGLSIEWHPHHQLVLGGTLLQPVPDGKVLQEGEGRSGQVRGEW